VKNKSKKKYFFGSVVAVVAVIFIIFLISGNNSASLPHLNSIDTKISQYSDSHITKNAIKTDPEFKNIAFDTNTPRQSFFSNQLAAVIKTVKSFTTLSTKKESVSKEYGSWIWTPVMDMSPEYMKSILSQAKADGVNTIYVSIDTYLDIFVMPKGPAREAQKKIFGDKLEYFIAKAESKGIVVDAEAGWRNWGEDDNLYKGFAIVNYVKNFNASRQNKFRGFQYDVEPYLLDSYEKNKVSVLKNFIKLIDQTENFMSTSTLKFSVVIPDFYDEKDQLTPKFSYNGRDGYTLNHLLNILDRRPDSSIIVMSYRNFAEGQDGAIEISKNEMQTADRGAFNTKIIIAQETGDVTPTYITFHGTSKNYLLRELDKINSVFAAYSNFGGLAIHYANAFVALK
jgi:hypothetical protein